MSAEEAIAREHIRDRMSRYTMWRDANNTEKFLENWADDAVFESVAFRLKNKKEIEAYYADNASPKMPAKFRRHNITTAMIDITSPTTAEAKAYYFVITDIGPDHSGYYLDRYRLENGKWLFTYRGCWVEWCMPNSVYVPDYAKRALAEGGECGPAQAK